mmetsp:Transcript_4854/g.15075  ORF Transcript_4854/g.15075 Transcript_4854/m.15075 type:complete len:347 (+) Transcript_4854:1282-2322(+)
MLCPFDTPPPSPPPTTLKQTMGGRHPHRRHVQPGRHDEGDDGEGDGPEQGDHVAEVGEQDGHRARAKDRERLEAGPAVRRGLLHRQARGRGQARAHELCVQHGARGAQEQRVLREHLEHMPRGHKLKREGERDDEAEQALDQDAPHPLNVERDNALGVVPVQPIPQGAEGEEHHGEHGLAAVEHLLEPVRLLHRVLDGQHRGDAFDGEDGDAEEDGEGLPPRPGVDLAEDAHGAVLVADGGEGEAVGHDEQHRRDHGHLGEHEQGRERRHVLELHEEGEGAGPQDYEDDVGAVRVLLGEGREHVVDDGREGDGEEDEVGDAVADLIEIVYTYMQEEATSDAVADLI